MADSFIKTEINSQSFREAEQLLTRIPLELRTVVLPKAIRAAARPAVVAMRHMAPDSVRSGSRRGWSKSLRAKRQGKQIKDTIGTSSVRQYRQIVSIYVGPLWPSGVLINVIGHDRRQVLWGKETGRTVPANDFVEAAGWATEAAQQSEFIAKVKAETDALLASGARP